MLLPCAAGAFAGTTVLFLGLWLAERRRAQRYQEASRKLARQVAAAKDRVDDWRARG